MCVPGYRAYFCSHHTVARCNNVTNNSLLLPLNLVGLFLRFFCSSSCFFLLYAVFLFTFDGQHSSLNIPDCSNRSKIAFLWQFYKWNCNSCRVCLWTWLLLIRYCCCSRKLSLFLLRQYVRWRDQFSSLADANEVNQSFIPLFSGLLILDSEILDYLCHRRRAKEKKQLCHLTSSISMSIMNG
jgi:hypothetical protein